jgi:ABC-type multidrug transport system fused ATPase/permease subunit
VFDHILTFAPGYFETVRTGEVISRLTNDTTMLETVIGSSASMAIRNMLLMIGGLVMNLAGPEMLKLGFHIFVVIVGALILSGAVNTSLIGVNGVLNRVAEDAMEAEAVSERNKKTVFTRDLGEWFKERFPRVYKSSPGSCCHWLTLLCLLWPMMETLKPFPTRSSGQQSSLQQFSRSSGCPATGSMS